MNRLAEATSLYLRQHADNPVDWYPWGEEALELARRTDRPVLLSIGYSACHWCHVMAHECFSDPRIAELMNQYFVNVKVDREERPDLDRIYQLAHRALTQRGGGWPLTVFLDGGDATPFFGGTYFPPRPRHGLPAFPELLLSVARLYQERRSDLRLQGARLREFLAEQAQVQGGKEVPGTGATGAAVEQLARHHDPDYGGFGTAPKFPQPPSLELLQIVEQRMAGSTARVARRMLDLTLRTMGRGGLHDQLAGGFFRYCVDRQWTIPHFEKLLCDNALLLPIYAEAARGASDGEFAELASATAGWLEETMRAPQGGYHASLDAGSDGEEGRYYLWSGEEFEAALPAEVLAVATMAYGLDGRPNYEDRLWHLVRRQRIDAIARRLERDAREVARCLDAVREELLEARRRRRAPGCDRKLLTAWNGLAAAGLARAGGLLGREDWIDGAEATLERLAADCVDAEGRVRVQAGGGHGFLDDHAFVLWALLCMLEHRWRDRWLDWAERLAHTLLADFEDREGGGFFFTPAYQEGLIQRPRSFADESLPAGNGVAARSLLRLAQLTGEADLTAAAERVLKAAAAEISRAPHAHCSMLIAVAEYHQPLPQVILRGAVAERPSPTRCVSYLVPEDSRLAARFPLRGAFTAYLCTDMVCGPPIDSPTRLARALAG